MAGIGRENPIKIDLVISVDDIVNLKSFETKQIRLRDQTWTVTFLKSTTKLTNVTSEDVLAIELNLKTDNTSNDWATVATISVKTIQAENLDKSRKQKSEPIVFNSKLLTWHQTFVTWKDLIDPENGFIDENGSCSFKIKIKSSPMHNVASDDPVKFEINRKCCSDGSYGKFRLTVKNLHKNFGVTSPEIHLNKMPWRIVVVKEENVRVLLWNMNFEEKLSWCCSTNVECSINSFDTETDPMTKKLQKNDRSVSPLEIFSITWNDLIKPEKQFLQNGAFVLDIEMKINHPEQAQVKEVKCTECSRFKCPICLKSMIGKDVVSTSCGHLFCGKCLKKEIMPNHNSYYDYDDEASCPKCGTYISKAKNRKINL